MAKEYAVSFYNSKKWERCRKSYLSKHNLCERCLIRGEYVPAKIVHHKTYITESNIHDTDITLNHDNLEALCQECHNYEHLNKDIELRYTFDKEGNVIPIDNNI